MNATLPSFPGHRRHEATRVVVACTMLTLTSACSEVAGLQEHLPYLGFPDSRSNVLCASDDVTSPNRVPCDGNQVTRLQDGHLQMMRPEYFVEGNDIRDSITELVWHKRNKHVSNYDEAETYCKNLDGDYRLPSKIELISLLDYGGTDFLLDPLFENRQAMKYRSSTEYWPESPQFLTTHWAVDFNGKREDLPIGSTLPGEVHQQHDSNESGVVCVRNDSGPFEPGPFKTAGAENELQFDERTNLYWMTIPIAVKSWQEALTECSELVDGGFDDFRLPNAKEIATIITDETTILAQSRPREIFDIGSNDYLWTSTPTTDAREAFALSANGASISGADRTLQYYRALCVRGPY